MLDNNGISYNLSSALLTSTILLTNFIRSTSKFDQLDEMGIRKVTRKPKSFSEESKTRVSKWGTSKLLNKDEIPLWMSDNPYIYTGFRSIQYSYLGCVRSLFYIHNETGNIMSHLVATLTFVFIWVVSFLVYIPLLRTSTVIHSQ